MYIYKCLQTHEKIIILQNHKMVHNQIYDDLISCRCCAESSGCETGRPSYNHKACGVVAKPGALRNGSLCLRCS